MIEQVKENQIPAHSTPAAALGKPTPLEEYMLDKDGYVSASCPRDVPPL